MLDTASHDPAALAALMSRAAREYEAWGALFLDTQAALAEHGIIVDGLMRQPIRGDDYHPENMG